MCFIVMGNEYMMPYNGMVSSQPTVEDMKQIIFEEKVQLPIPVFEEVITNCCISLFQSLVLY